MQSIKKNQKTVGGQTILEVIIALNLIIFFLTGVVVVQLIALKNVDYFKTKSIATKLAREQLERARVVRDSVGISQLAEICQTDCYINNLLTPVPITPTGVYSQSLILQTASSLDCPFPEITITPEPVSYKATVIIDWSQGAVDVTPAPEIVLTSCLTDWR